MSLHSCSYAHHSIDTSTFFLFVSTFFLFLLLSFFQNVFTFCPFLTFLFIFEDYISFFDFLTFPKIKNLHFLKTPSLLGVCEKVLWCPLEVAHGQETRENQQAPLALRKLFCLSFLLSDRKREVVSCGGTDSGCVPALQIAGDCRRRRRLVPEPTSATLGDEAAALTVSTEQETRSLSANRWRKHELPRRWPAGDEPWSETFSRCRQPWFEHIRSVG